MRTHNDKDEVAKASKKGNLKRTHPAKEEKKVDPGGGKNRGWKPGLTRPSGAGSLAFLLSLDCCVVGLKAASDV